MARPLVDVCWDPLPAVVDAEDALPPDTLRLHDGWPDNIMMRTRGARLESHSGHRL
jgi:CO/xanthine dehydrogenase Mo-binding subunit